MKARRSTDEAGIDITPMLDIVFIMLIFFIVTTSFVREDGITINRPSNNDQPLEKEQKGNLLISVKPNGRITIDRRDVDLRQVRSNVEVFKAKNPEGSVVVTADVDSTTGVLVEVLDQIRQAGIENPSVATGKSIN